MKMLFTTDANGWPVRLVSETHEGPAPVGHVAFEDLRAMVNWQEAHPELKPPAPPEQIPVPEVVTRRQFRGALRRVGLFDLVDGLRNSPDLDDMTRGDLIDFLDAATLIERNHPMIAAFAPMLGPNGVTEAQIDDVFRLAASL